MSRDGMQEALVHVAAAAGNFSLSVCRDKLGYSQRVIANFELPRT